MGNRFIKQTAAAVLLTTSVLSFSPAALGASTSVDQSVSKVKTELNKASTLYIYPALEGKLATSDSLYPVLNSAKKNYQNAVKEIQSSKLSQKEKQAKLKEIETLYNEKITKGLVPYIDAYNYATKYLDPLLADIKVAEAKNDFAAVEKAYHQLSYQLKGRTAILYRFSGKASRDLLLDKYKQPSDQKRDELMVPVTIYMKMVEVEKLVSEKKLEEAKKVMESIQALVDRLPASNSFVTALLKQVEKVQEVVTPVTPPIGGGGGGGSADKTAEQLLNEKITAELKGANLQEDSRISIKLEGNTFFVTIKDPDSTLKDFVQLKASESVYKAFQNVAKVTSVNVTFLGKVLPVTLDDEDNKLGFEQAIDKTIAKLNAFIEEKGLKDVVIDKETSKLSILKDEKISFTVTGVINNKPVTDTYTFDFK